MNRSIGLLGTVLLVSVALVASAEEPKSRDAAARVAAQDVLPLSEVVLYSSGVGYFQRDGSIDGRGDVELRFKVDDVNDLLKSMVV